MSLDSIHKKKANPILSNQPKNQNFFIIPVIIIIIVIVGIWVIVLKHNFSRINEKSQTKTDPAAEEVSQALENLTKKLDNLKEQKIFLQSASSPVDSLVGEADKTDAAADFQAQEDSQTTNGHSYPSEEIPMPAQQY